MHQSILTQYPHNVILHLPFLVQFCQIRVSRRHLCPAKMPSCTSTQEWQPTLAGPCCLPAHTQLSQMGHTKTPGLLLSRARPKSCPKARKQLAVPGCHLLPLRPNQVSHPLICETSKEWEPIQIRLSRPSTKRLSLGFRSCSVRQES